MVHSGACKRTCLDAGECRCTVKSATAHGRVLTVDMRVKEVGYLSAALVADEDLEAHGAVTEHDVLGKGSQGGSAGGEMCSERSKLSVSRSGI